MLEDLRIRVEDLAGLQATVTKNGTSDSVAHGQCRPEQEMSTQDLFQVWCLIKPIALGATIAIAEQLADGLDTPVRSLSPLGQEAALAPDITLDDLQRLSLPVNATGLMEAICLPERDLRTQLVDEISRAGVEVVRDTAFHSEYTLWRIVGECLETLTGRQASTALNNLLVTAGLDAQFSIEPTSLRVKRIVDYFAQTESGRCALPHGRSGVVLSTWSMPLGGFTNSRAVAEWASAVFFRENEAFGQGLRELFPSAASTERMVVDFISGRSAAVLGLRGAGSGQLSCRGWLGLSILAVDLTDRTTAAVLCNDLTCDTDRLAGLADQVRSRE